MSAADPVPEVVEVIIIIDAETILKNQGTNTDPTNPVPVGDQTLIYMITKKGNIVSGNTGNELTISVNTDDIIRWRETTLSLNSDYDAILYQFVDQTGGGLISTPQPILSTVTVPLPNPANPLLFGTQQIKNYYWQATPQNPGTDTYHFNFMIVAKDGTVQGYFWFDPFIQIAS